MSANVRVAIVGAGRIGRQHAKWLRMLGCELAGFLGSTPESVANTEAALESMLGVRVPGYTDFARLVAETRPHAVTVCSPHHWHCQHVLDSIEAGLPTFCEKPLAWDERKTYAEILADGRRMVDAARANGILLAMNAQYVAGMRPYLEWYESERGPLERPQRYEAVMQSRGRGGGAEFEEIWIDLGAHPLSLIVKWNPDVRLVPGSVHCVLRRKEVIAHFQCLSAVTGNVCDCHIRLGNVPEGALQRRFGVNGFLVDYEGRNDANGVFRAYLSHDGVEREYTDLLHSSIDHFIRAVRGEAEPLISAEEAYRNLELQVQVLEHAVREE